MVSEWRRPRPDSRVLDWWDQADLNTFSLSVITLSEIRLGVERLAHGDRRRTLEAWLTDDLPAAFHGRIIAVDDAVSDACGRIRARSMALGKPMPILDAFIAATADVHDLTLVTRNVSDFDAWGGPVFNPWDQTGPV